MSGYIIRPLGPCAWNEVVGQTEAPVDGWCWAGHDGLVTSASGPINIVPTGWLWAWGPDRWVRWRIDPVAPCVGAELRRGAPEAGGMPGGFVAAHVLRDGGPQHVGLRPDGGHMLRWAPGALPVTALSVITITAPSSMTFVGIALGSLQ